MKRIINFLSKLRFWPFIFFLIFLAIIMAELLIIVQSYWLIGNFFTKNLLIVAFITPVIVGFIIFTPVAFLIQHLKNLQDEEEELVSSLSEQRELLRSVIDENPDPVIVKDWEGKFVLANNACAILYGTTPEDMIAKDDGDYIPDKEQAAFFKQNVQEIMRSGEIHTVYEDSIDVESGERRNYKSVKIPYKTSTYEDHILVVAHDITEQKQREEELRFMNYALDKASDASFLVDERGKLLKVNEAASRDLGYTKEKLLLLYVFDINTEIPKDKWPQEFNRVKDIGASVIETLHRRKDGSTYAAEVSINYVEYQGKEYHLAFSRDITEKKEQQEKLEYMAHFDALTDLPNRLVLADRIEQTIAQSARRECLVAVAYLDLDGFKEVNDTHGHDVGDTLLKALSVKMKGLLRKGDTIARIGGDEFVALLTDFTQKDDIKHFLDRTLEAISSPIEVDGNVVNVSASIGVAFYSKEENLGAEKLIRQADIAMYGAKVHGKNRYEFFTEGLEIDNK